MGNEHKILIAGFGGQGVVLAGNLLARACIFENKYVTGMVAYGAEMRGGTASAAIIISDEEIASPVVENPDIALILNHPSLEKFEESLTEGGLMVLNTSLVKRGVLRKDLRQADIDATNIAEALGQTRIANIVGLGALLKVCELVKLESVARAIDELFAEKKGTMAQINKSALYEGAKLVSYTP